MDYYKNLDLSDIKYFCEFDKIWKIEQWKDIPNYEGIYQVSDLGRAKSLKFNKKRILSQSSKKGEYFRICICKNKINKTRTIHSLVSECFLNHNPCGYNLVVNHKNFIKTDNRKLNLEIISQRKNTNKKHLKSSSKFTGVSWDKLTEKWISQIFVNGKVLYIGRFTKQIDAYRYYKKALKSIKNGTEIIVIESNFTSKYKGVSWHKKNKKWQSQCRINSKQIHLGYFDYEIDAYKAYQSKLKQII